MKTPDEIKKGLRVCVNDACGCSEKCPYFNSSSNGVDCASVMHTDAITYIHQLESRLAQVERERDAAAKDLYAHDKCLVCKQELFGDGSYIQNACFDCVKRCNFKWRGVCAENTEEETNDEK
jgi:hypothetical protein